MFRQQLTDVQDALILAHAIVDSVREPLIVLDQDLRVVAASQSFYLKFKVKSDIRSARSCTIWETASGPRLRACWERVFPTRGAMENYEVEHDFPGLGHRTMLLNAHKVFYKAGSHSTILLGIADITEQHPENEKNELISQKQVLLEELEHRMVNSLQIIARSSC